MGYDANLSVFYDEWSALFGWAHAEAKQGNIKRAKKLFDIAERLSERNRKYNNNQWR